MSLTGTVEQGTIRLPAGADLPDGTVVRIVPVSDTVAGAFGKRFASFVGMVDDAPEDLAANLDHYLYGAPTRKP